MQNPDSLDELVAVGDALGSRLRRVRRSRGRHMPARQPAALRQFRPRGLQIRRALPPGGRRAGHAAMKPILWFRATTGAGAFACTPCCAPASDSLRQLIERSLGNPAGYAAVAAEARHSTWPPRTAVWCRHRVSCGPRRMCGNGTRIDPPSSRQTVAGVAREFRWSTV